MKEHIIYEDDDLLIWNKPAGLATQTNRVSEKDLVSVVTNYLKGGYVALLNRLDQQVEGLVLFAKTQQVAGILTKQIQQNKIDKTYRALVLGEAKETEELIHYLYKEKQGNHSVVVDKQHREAKRAHLTYERENSGDYLIPEGVVLVKIALHTGRHHQIRLQFSEEGMPLVGDYKYGTEQSKEMARTLGCNQIALSACELGFIHPTTGKRVEVKIVPTWLQAIET